MKPSRSLPPCLLAFALWLGCGSVHAADERHSVLPAQRSATLLQQGVRQMIALPADLAKLVLVVPALAAPVGDSQWQAAIVRRSLTSLHLPGFTQRENLNAMLEASSMRVWLRDDVNLHCDVAEAPVFAAADEFLVKLELQFRFR